MVLKEHVTKCLTAVFSVGLGRQWSSMAQSNKIYEVLYTKKILIGSIGLTGSVFLSGLV